MDGSCGSKFCILFQCLELIALLESDIDSQLELKKATDNIGSILCTL